MDDDCTNPRGLPLIFRDSLQCVPRDYRSPLRGLAERKKLHDAVLEYRSQGMSYNRIIQTVEEEFHVRLSKSHVSDWLRSKHRPDGSVTKFEATPSPALGYVIGTVLGDGSTSIGSDHNYLIKLRVKDRDFAETFSFAIGKVLARSPPNVHLNPRTGSWHVSVSSVLLQNFLRQPVHNLRDTIMHCTKCSGAFLRGFFDAEGSISGRSLTASNGDIGLLSLAVDALRSLDIQVTGPHLLRRGGRAVVIKGRTWHSNLDHYYLYVRTCSLEAFASKVGFSIGRKSDGLNSAIMEDREVQESNLQGQTKVKNAFDWITEHELS